MYVCCWGIACISSKGGVFDMGVHVLIVRFLPSISPLCMYVCMCVCVCVCVWVSGWVGVRVLASQSGYGWPYLTLLDNCGC